MTSTINLADRVVPGGYFLRNPAKKRTPFTASGADRDAETRHCWTYAGGGSSIGLELIQMLDTARDKVFVGTFYLGDTEVRKALMRAADRLRGGVYVLSALDNKGLDEAINKVDDATPIDEQTEYRNFGELTKRGIYVRGYQGMHAKFVVVDDKVALVSSANLVTRSFDNVGENGVVVSNPSFVDSLARLFARLWQESKWDMPPHHETPTVADRHLGEATTSHITLAEPDGNGPIWTRSTQRSIAKALYETVENAQADLMLATFSIANMAHALPKTPAEPKLLFDPVCRAIDRGVRVRMLLRGRNNVHAARAEASAFAEAGVEIVPDSLNHAKGVIADGTRGALFSANFLTDLGLTGGVEVGMRLDDTPALAEARRYFEHVIAEADLRFAADPQLGELAQSIYARALAPWPLPEKIDVIVENMHWQQFADQEGVVLYERSGDGPITLYSGRDRWRLENMEGWWWLGPIEQAATPAADIFESWLVARNRPPEMVLRGLCHATFTQTEI
ncbi:phospholipase D-like domain-containing protein [Actinocrispum sp. NPDC049592]|uniref:phospholipase D-like domain-containing protein n=1 Tax=Actinocrispum sp. NPDC049592 TaxID=3154835 RepID=UPI003446CFE5